MFYSAFTPFCHSAIHGLYSISQRYQSMSLPDLYHHLALKAMLSTTTATESVQSFFSSGPPTGALASCTAAGMHCRHLSARSLARQSQSRQTRSSLLREGRDGTMPSRRNLGWLSEEDQFSVEQRARAPSDNSKRKITAIQPMAARQGSSWLEQGFSLGYWKTARQRAS